jgi:hypothetical protein
MKPSVIFITLLESFFSGKDRNVFTLKSVN